MKRKTPIHPFMVSPHARKLVSDYAEAVRAEAMADMFDGKIEFDDIQRHRRNVETLLLDWIARQEKRDPRLREKPEAEQPVEVESDNDMVLRVWYARPNPLRLFGRFERATALRLEEQGLLRINIAPHTRIHYAYLTDAGYAFLGKEKDPAP